jgi:hypothetical protein
VELGPNLDIIGPKHRGAFEEPPLRDHLHIIVQIPISGELLKHTSQLVLGLNEAEIDQMLEKIEPELLDYVGTKIQPPFWKVPDGSDREWMEHVSSLEIPILHGQPSLLLHGIGDPRWHQHDGQFLERIKSIFTPGRHTYVPSVYLQLFSIMV